MYSESLFKHTRRTVELKQLSIIFQQWYIAGMEFTQRVRQKYDKN